MNGRTLAAAMVGWLAIVGLLSLAIAIANRRSPPLAETPRAAVPDAAPETTIAAPELDGGVVADIAEAPYPLDQLERTPALVAEGCPEVPLVDHAGAAVSWRPALRVHPAFVPSVEDIERVLIDAARARYGRAPIALLSASSHRCRTMRGRPDRISEHALGNALDVRGIVLPGGEHGEREVTVREHWGDGSIDDAFLHDVARAMLESPRVRGVIGPPTANHLDHFHFDRGPSRFVSIDID